MREATCPRCGKPVEAEWLICPHCEAVLRGLERGSRGGATHGAIRRGLAISENLIVRILAKFGLIGLLSIGIAVAIEVLRQFGAQAAAATLVGLFSIPIIAVIAFGSFSDRPSALITKALLVGALAFGGGLMLFFFALFFVIGLLSRWR